MSKSHINLQNFYHAQWPVQNVQAFTTSRLSPFKSHESFNHQDYGAFNLGTHVGDDLVQVLHNRKQLQILLPEKTKIQWLSQVHKNYVLTLTQHTTAPLTADAVITSQKNIALSIMTADCLPILLSNIKGQTIGAIHGGWRSLALNIIEKTINHMHISPQNLYAWLGPCISKKAFEVGAEVRATFIEQNLAFISAFTASHDQKYFADLREIATIQLNHIGVNNIYSLPQCTFSQPEQYYSYRRDQKTGRMATIITRIS